MEEVLWYEGNGAVFCVCCSSLQLLLPLSFLVFCFLLLQHYRPATAAVENKWLAGVGACMVLLLLIVADAALAVKQECAAAAAPAAGEQQQQQRQQQRDPSSRRHE